MSSVAYWCASGTLLLLAVVPPVSSSRPTNQGCISHVHASALVYLLLRVTGASSNLVCLTVDPVNQFKMPVAGDGSAGRADRAEDWF